MSTDLEKEIKEIQLDDIEVEKKEENQINPKIAKPKRNPFEKIIDDSIIICDEIIEKDQSESNVDRLLKTMEKEIMKKEEFYNLVKLYEQTKKLKEDQTNFEDTKVKGDFNEIKNNLQNIKNLYENKKKILNKNKAEDKEKEEKIEQPSKKKTSNKKSSEILDVSNIVAKISTIEENEKIEEKEIIEECKTPVRELELQEVKEMAEPDGILTSPAQNKILDSKESLILSGESVLIKNSIAKENSSKKTKSENNNKSITNFFKPKIAPLISNSGASLLAKSKSYSEEDNKSHIDNENNLMILDLPAENEMLNNIELSKSKERKHSSQAMFIVNSHNHHLSTLDYRLENLQLNSSQHKTSYYTIKGNNIHDKTAYHQSFKNYFEEISLIKKTQSNKTKINKRKMIYIHDSFLTHRKILNKSSNVIKGRNPFKKDEYLIDYDKDSEEEFLEENAEDIKSNDNSADEEEIPEDEEEEAIKWIVPDGHLSEDEVSQIDELDNANVNQKKKKTVMEIMEIRKNFPKPVFVSFNQPVTFMDNKVKLLYNLCKAKIFNLNPANNDNLALANNEENILELDDNLNMIANKQFPIKLTSNKSEEIGRKTGMNNNIKDKLEDLVREIHLSYMTKEYLIKLISENYNDISKKSLCNFFKDCVLRVKCKNTLRRQWLVKKEILENANFLMSEYNQLLEKQNAFYEEKDKEKKKEIEDNQMNNQNILNEQKGVNFSNFDLSTPNNFNLNNFNLNSLRNNQIPNSIEMNPSILNNQFNIQNYSVNLHINNNDPLNQILNSTEISKKKRIKKEKLSPKKPKTKSKVKLNINSAKKEAENPIVNNDQQFDLRTFNFASVRQEIIKKKDSI